MRSSGVDLTYHARLADVDEGTAGPVLGDHFDPCFAGAPATWLPAQPRHGFRYGAIPLLELPLCRPGQRPSCGMGDVSPIGPRPGRASPFSGNALSQEQAIPRCFRSLNSSQPGAADLASGPPGLLSGRHTPSQVVEKVDDKDGLDGRGLFLAGGGIEDYRNALAVRSDGVFSYDHRGPEPGLPISTRFPSGEKRTSV